MMTPFMPIYDEEPDIQMEETEKMSPKSDDKEWEDKLEDESIMNDAGKKKLQPKEPGPISKQPEFCTTGYRGLVP